MHDLATCSLAPQTVPSFAERLATISDFLPADIRQRIVAEIAGVVDTERSYLPLHKQGGTVAYETLREHAPTVVALYRSPAMRKAIAGIVGLDVQTTPLTDKSSCSVLYYVKPGDLSAGTMTTISTRAGTSRCCSQLPIKARDRTACRRRAFSCAAAGMSGSSRRRPIPSSSLKVPGSCIA
jgi:hypothetical protein